MTMTMAQETEMIEAAAAELRQRGIAGTPQRIERVANSARGKNTTVAEVVAAVNKVCEQQRDPMEGRRVVGLFLTPDGEVVKRVQVGQREQQQFALPIAHHARCVSAHHFDLARQAASQSPAADDLAKLQAKRQALQAIIDDPATSDQARVKAQGELIKVTEEIAALEVALHPVPLVGKAPTAGAQQYAPTVPYWNEPRVSASKKAELEAEAAGLRTQLRSPDLTPSQKIRLQQALTHIERTLGKTGTGDAVPPQHR